MGKFANTMAERNQYYWSFLLPQASVDLRTSLCDPVISNFDIFSTIGFCIIFILKYYIKYLIIEFSVTTLNFVPKLNISFVLFNLP